MARKYLGLKWWQWLVVVVWVLSAASTTFSYTSPGALVGSLVGSVIVAYAVVLGIASFFRGRSEGKAAEEAAVE